MKDSVMHFSTTEKLPPAIHLKHIRSSDSYCTTSQAMGIIDQLSRFVFRPIRSTSRGSVYQGRGTEDIISTNDVTKRMSSWHCKYAARSVDPTDEEGRDRVQERGHFYDKRHHSCCERGIILHHGPSTM